MSDPTEAATETVVAGLAAGTATVAADRSAPEESTSAAVAAESTNDLSASQTPQTNSKPRIDVAVVIDMV